MSPFLSSFPFSSTLDLIGHHNAGNQASNSASMLTNDIMSSFNNNLQQSTIANTGSTMSDQCTTPGQSNENENDPGGEIHKRKRRRKSNRPSINLTTERDASFSDDFDDEEPELEDDFDNVMSDDYNNEDDVQSFSTQHHRRKSAKRRKLIENGTFDHDDDEHDEDDDYSNYEFENEDDIGCFDEDEDGYDPLIGKTGEDNDDIVQDLSVSKSISLKSQFETLNDELDKQNQVVDLMELILLLIDYFFYIPGKK